MSDRDQPDEGEEPTPPWLRAALETPVEVDPAVRDAHVRAAMHVFDEAAFDEAGFDEQASESRTIAPVVDLTRRRRRAPWLAAAAAIVLAIGVAGWWVGDQDTTGTADQLASKSARESVDATSAPQSESDLGAAADSSGDSSFGAAPAPVDLGEFSSEVALREVVRALPSGSIAATKSPSTMAATDEATTRAESGAAAPVIAPTCPTPAGVNATTAEHHTATVAGAPVEVWVEGRGDGAVIVVVDRASCTVRSG
jgi:hypothetical protein